MKLRKRTRVSTKVENMKDEPLPAKRARRSKTQNEPPTQRPRQTRYMLRNRNNEKYAAKSAEPTQMNLNLLDLNDDCLLHILQNMCPTQLCNMAETCKRLQAMARYAFRLKYKRLDLKTSQGMNAIKRLLKNFGGQTSTLQIVHSNSCHTSLHCNCTLGKSKKLLTWIVRYCRQNLVDLTLKGFRIESDMMNKAKERFASLETLTLDTCILFDCTLNACKESLQVLHLDDVVFYSSSGFKQIYRPLLAFIRTAKVLCELSITGCHDVPMTVFAAISKLSNLKTLRLNGNTIVSETQFDQQMPQFSAMQNLTTFNFDLFGHSAFQIVHGLVANNVAIEHLELHNCPLDNGTIEQICQMQSIKNLSLDRLNNENILRLGSELKQLMKFFISSCNIVTPEGLTAMLRQAKRLEYLEVNMPNFVFSLNTYENMLHIMKRRKEQRKLDFVFHTYGDEQWDSVDVLEENEKWLSVNECVHFFRLILLI
ncbi:uncharacterized protein LOC116345392 [Contarinia nasturtii]|uniref:uncharacterized protein LOC116345392 n=1 Tax=Contarinia nasturtii TaxID=265458 RepID=UPI0012D3ECE6|nr:uncharacterized protein LOC116345392 [Contarinia nasturtii]